MNNNTGLRFDNHKMNILSIVKAKLIAEAISITTTSGKAEVLRSAQEFDEIPVTDQDIREYLIQFQPALIQVIRHAKAGAFKYSKGNWLGGMKWSKVINPLLRHLLIFLVCGITRDHESGSKHLTAIAWNALAILTYDELGIGENDLRTTEI